MPGILTFPSGPKHQRCYLFWDTLVLCCSPRLYSVFWRLACFLLYFYFNIKFWVCVEIFLIFYFYFKDFLAVTPKNLNILAILDQYFIELSLFQQLFGISNFLISYIYILPQRPAVQLLLKGVTDVGCRKAITPKSEPHPTPPSLPLPPSLRQFFVRAF